MVAPDCRITPVYNVLMNPYSKYLGKRDARGAIAETAGRLGALAQQLGPDGLRRKPAPDKWSAAEILCHLADCEIVFAYRLRQALAEPHHIIQPFDQEVWAAAYGAIDGSQALALFGCVRLWNVALFDRMAPADFDKRLSHPERGEMTVRTVLETMAGHDLNHLAQMERIAAGEAASA